MSKTTQTCQCDKCHGTGEYRYVSKKNGKPASGMCYQCQCQGKGQMTRSDSLRTSSYWMHRAISGE